MRSLAPVANPLPSNGPSAVQYGPAGYDSSYAPAALVAANIASRQQAPAYQSGGGFNTAIGGAQAAVYGQGLGQSALGAGNNGQSVGLNVAGQDFQGQQMLQKQKLMEMLAQRKRDQEMADAALSLSQRQKELQLTADEAYKNRTSQNFMAGLKLTGNVIGGLGGMGGG